MRNLNFHAYLLALCTVVPACGGKDDGTASGGSSSTADTGGSTDSSTDASATVTPGTSDGTSGGSVSATGTATEDPTAATDPSGTTTVDPSTTNPQETSTTDPVETTTTVDPSEGTTLDTLGTTTDIVDSTSDTLAMTTGAADVCAMLGPQQCMSNPLCLAILGGKVNVAKMCAGKPMFLGCVEAMGCGDAITYACDPEVNPPEPFVFNDTCIPEGWTQCESPEVMGPCK